MVEWDIMFKNSDRDLTFIGESQGAILEEAVMNGMMKKPHFRERMREELEDFEGDEVEFLGYPLDQARTTKFDRGKLEKGNY